MCLVERRARAPGGQDIVADNTAVARDGDTNLRAAIWLWSGVLVAVAVLFGGASRENPLRLATVEIVSLPLLVMAFLRSVRFGTPRGTAAALVLLVLVISLPLIQILPLPPFVWTSLPGRAPEVEALRVADLPQPWLPLSLAARDTTSAVLALAPPVAMFLAALHLRPRGARLLVWGWIALAGTSLVLGAAQLSVSAPSPLYPYATTNVGSLVGFFANRNHEAAFLLALLPFAAVFAAGPGTQRRAFVSARWVASLYLFLAVVGLAAVRSRAGVLLAGPAILASALVVVRTRTSRATAPRVAAVGGVGLALAAVAMFGLSPIVQRFDEGAPSAFRFEAWPVIVRAAGAFQPVGAGVGSFDRVFRSVEPLSMVGPTYFNHAHNDWLELWLEAGWAGAGLMAAFLAWLGLAAWQAWRDQTGEEAAFARAASVSIVLLLACSVVDYPLRTETLVTLFAWCCGILAVHGAGRPAASR